MGCFDILPAPPPALYCSIMHTIKHCCVPQVNEARRGEMQALAVRKYLDALCVYFWAATSLLFSLCTFGLFVLLGHKLTAEVVFTSLALFNVLISPLNSFPWVLNGLVEAVVSVRRLQGFLSSWETKSDWAYQTGTLQDAILRADSVSALAQHERNALAEGLTSEALQMSRADSSDLYTTINMERLPSGASPRLSTTPSFGAWSPMHGQQSSSAPTSTHPSPLQQRSGPPPAPGDNPNPNCNPSPAARTFSTSFKGWGQALGATQRQGSSSTVSASDQESQTSDPGIVTVLSDSSRLAATASGDGHSVVLSGASFAWQPTLGRSRVVSQVRRQDSSRHGQGYPGRQGVLQPLLSDAAQQDGSSSDLVLHEINLTVRSGDLLVVTGEVGAGECPSCIYSLFCICSPAFGTVASLASSRAVHLQFCLKHLLSFDHCKCCHAVSNRFVLLCRTFTLFLWSFAIVQNAQPAFEMHQHAGHTVSPSPRAQSYTV